MEVENITEFTELRRGRPVIYPFEKLGPATKLTIPGNNDLIKQRVSVFNSLAYYKIKNGLRWVTSVLIEGENIVVYRKN